MKRTVSVPNTVCGEDTSYSVRVDYAEAIRLGAEKIGAAKVGRNYYYRAEEVDEVLRLTPMEVAQLGAGELDDRGSDYSLWCATTGRSIERPSRTVRAALGMEGMKNKSYLVFLASDGCDEEYLGEVGSIRAAKQMAAQHARGERYALAKSLYDTARAAGHCLGTSAPPARDEVGEPVEWFGRGGWYCACPRKSPK